MLEWGQREKGNMEQINDEQLNQEQLDIIAKEGEDIRETLRTEEAMRGIEGRRAAVDRIVKTEAPRVFVKTHPYGKFEYIPIAILEPLAQALDPNTYSELLREGTVANGFYCVVRLYFNGRTYDGVGAAEFQTKKGASASDFSNLNTGAIVMGVPKARSEALKNAYAQIGDLFGRGIRRPANISMDVMENSKLVREARVAEKRKELGK